MGLRRYVRPRSLRPGNAVCSQLNLCHACVVRVSCVLCAQER
jgi:hypothetical protein